MKREELKTGHVLVYENGEKAVIARNSIGGDKYIKLKADSTSYWSHGDIKSLPEDLSGSVGSYKLNFSGPVVAVLEPKKKYLPIQQQFIRSNYTKVWSRTSIEITAKVNGNKVPLSQISEETLLNIRENS